MPYVDEQGLIRTESRLSDSSILPDETASPIILPKDDIIVRKYVLNLHQLHGHTGPGQTLYFLRRQFRICGGKREVSKILHLCITKNCRKLVPVAQKFAPLPSQRTDWQGPWMHVSTDFFGPLAIKVVCPSKKVCVKQEGEKSDASVATEKEKGGRKLRASTKKGKKTELPEVECAAEGKAWGCIFTCLQTRAVHLEVVDDMSTTTFFRAFIRMCSRRGLPNFVWSDNAKTFKATSKHLKQLYRAIDWTEIHDKAAVRNIEWRFGIEKAPSTNGVVERMVRSVKTALKVTLGSQPCPILHLETLLIEAEALVNDRPLVAPTEDDLDESTITPSQLCIGRTLRALPFDKKSNPNPNSSFTRMQLLRKELINKFFKRWRKDYLIGQQAVRFCGKDNAVLKKGQTVFLREENMAKGRWRLAIVEDTKKGRDGVIRRVKVRTTQGVVVRHINQISILENDSYAVQHEHLLPA